MVWVLVLGLLSACQNVTNECPLVSDWWYNNQPDTAAVDRPKNLGVMHNPSTVDTMGGHRSNR